MNYTAIWPYRPIIRADHVPVDFFPCQKRSLKCLRTFHGEIVYKYRNNRPYIAPKKQYKSLGELPPLGELTTLPHTPSQRGTQGIPHPGGGHPSHSLPSCRRLGVLLFSAFGASISASLSRHWQLIFRRAANEHDETFLAHFQINY